MAKINFQGLFADGKSIVIPKIQRDYAQGRHNVAHVRNSFLNAIYKALKEGKELNLDFIYGTEENAGKFIPLDGQQRLTTLFLLHWLVAHKENVGKEAEFLNRFTYETRYSSRRFCEFLTSGCFKPTFSEPISKEIINHPSFMMTWYDDPTVAGMLTMLDALNDVFYGEKPLDGLWNMLPNITFYQESISELGVTDDIYIKMNSRGKPLTRFEHLKAELDAIVSNTEFSTKLDTDWTDIFWNLRTEKEGELPVVDDSLLNYIRFVADIISFKRDGEPAPEDDFEMIRYAFADEDGRMLLSQAFDCWKNIDTNEFFNEWFSDNQSPANPLSVNIEQDVNLLKTIATSIKNNGNNAEKILLWGTVTYLLNKDKILAADFLRRIRVLRNLLWASANELREKRIAQIVSETEKLITEGVIDIDSNSFNKNQKEEETKKLNWLVTVDVEHEKKLATVENMDLLTGSTQSISVDKYGLYDTFISVFRDDQNWMEITRAILSCGDSTSHDRWRRIIPGKNYEIWKFVFQPGGNDLFREHFPEALSLMLGKIKEGETYSDIIDAYLSNQGTPKDWRYYIVKYPIIITKSEYGKYYFPTQYHNPATKRCPHFYSMSTRLSTSGRHWEAILLTLSTKSKDFKLGEYGNNLEIPLVHSDGTTPAILDGVEIPDGAMLRIANEDDWFVLLDVQSSPTIELKSIAIPQITPEIDSVDRVEFILHWL